MINITKPYLPDIDQYVEMIQEIWSRNVLTNNGPVVKQLENELKNYLNIDNLALVSNGTIAIQIAIKALGLEGEVITTPFSYIATTNSILWENCHPIFVDIDEESFNIDSNLIESQVNDETSAILATHVFGNPCSIDKIQEIAKKHNLKVIYDAAHAFGVEFKDQSIFKFGDISTLSMHATKLYHSIEGGLICCSDETILEKCQQMRNFGHNGPHVFSSIGINGKNSELHAAMGICNLRKIDEILNKRKEQYKLYHELLKDLPLQFQKINPLCRYNYSYFPVVFESNEKLLRAIEMLQANEIFPRRYFYPSLNTIGLISHEVMTISESIAERILCLPLYHELKKEQIKMIARLIQEIC